MLACVRVRICNARVRTTPQAMDWSRRTPLMAPVRLRCGDQENDTERRSAHHSDAALALQRRCQSIRNFTAHSLGGVPSRTRAAAHCSVV